MSQKTFTISSKLCWIALACLVVPMVGAYFFDDMFSTLSQIFQHPENLELGWNSANYGFFAGGYSFLCVWGGLIICGMLLDKFGVRIVGSVFVGLMVLGAAIVTFAISAGFAPGTSLTIAYIGNTIFGLGCEIAGVAITRSIAKWFKGRNVALAMGLQLAVARLGTATTFILSPILVAQKAPGEIYAISETSRPAFFGLMLLFIGAILWGVFVAMDAKFDKAKGAVTEEGESGKKDKFTFADVIKVLTNKRFIMISLICVFFYCCIISFKKFGTAIVIPRFGMDLDTAKWTITMIPFFTVLFTPLFGALVDKIGKATIWMIIGSVLVLVAHLIIGFAPSGVPFYGYLGIAILGVGYSLVPSAMWPSVPKIVPEKTLGTAYSLIYWIQNMGMMLVPIFIGRVFRNSEDDTQSAAVGAECIFVGLAIVAIVVSVMLSVSSRRNPELELDLPNKKQ